MMLRRMFLAVSMAVVIAMLGGCTKCGPIWNDWGAPKSCRSDHL